MRWLYFSLESFPQLYDRSCVLWSIVIFDFWAIDKDTQDIVVCSVVTWSGNSVSHSLSQGGPATKSKKGTKVYSAETKKIYPEHSHLFLWIHEWWCDWCWVEINRSIGRWRKIEIRAWHDEEMRFGWPSSGTRNRIHSHSDASPLPISVMPAVIY